MRPSLLIRLFVVALLASCFASSAGATSPALVAKQAQAKRVLAQISAIDEQLSVITERYDTAQVELGTVRRNVRAERASLTVAQNQYRQAQGNVAKLLVHLYTDGQPSPLEAILGVKSVSDLIGLSEDEAAISREDKDVVTAAAVARSRVNQRLQALEADRAAAASALKELAEERGQIEHGLAQRRQLLSSVQTQITQIEARQRAQQERLAAEARARLAAERAALARRAAEQAALAKRAAQAQRAHALAQAKIAAAAREAAIQQAATTTAATTTPTLPPGTTPAAVTTADPASADPTTSTTTADASAAPLPAGHPQAAQIALQYIGVPYLWSGESPSGFDCSGLVSYVFAQLGVDLPHSAADQYGYGVDVPRDELQPGDLVFFDNLTHVGIYIGDNQIVNAPDTGSFVRIDSLAEPWYANHYVGARRV
jgi:cell wall-associated NlpC family hydrolase